MGYGDILNFSNSLNCVDRSALFEEIWAHNPCLAPSMECCYGAQSALHFGDVIIPSCSDIQQGDPLGRLGFCLALQPLVESIKAEVPNLDINVWYLDDGTPCGNPADLEAALEIIEHLGPSRVFFNRSKTLRHILRTSTFSSNPLHHLIFPLFGMVLFFLDALLVLSLFATLYS